MAELGAYAYVFRLDVSDLDASISDAPGGLYDRHTVSTLAAAAARLFDGPCFVVFEIGKGDRDAPDRGRLHAHVIAHRNDGPRHLVRDSERCKWVYDAPGLYRYLHKHDPPTLEALLDYTAVRVLSPTGKTPRVRRHFFSAKRTAWVAATALSLTFAESLPPVLPCGRCRRRHLRPCPDYLQAAAAAADRSRDHRPDIQPAAGQIDHLNHPEPAAAAAAFELESGLQIANLEKLEGKNGKVRPRPVARAPFRPRRPSPLATPNALARARGPPPPPARVRTSPLHHCLGRH